MAGKKLNQDMLKGEDILLNLREINIGPIDSYSSSTCAGAAFFEHELLESFTFKIAARWEVLVIQDIITSLNHDSSRYSDEIGLRLRKHLTRDEAEAILVGHRFIDFKSIDDIKNFAKRHLSPK